MSGLNMTDDVGEAGRNFLEQIEPFAAEREFEQAESGEIAARLHDRNEALLTGSATHEHDRDSTGGLLDNRQVDRRLVRITSGINPINCAA